MIPKEKIIDLYITQNMSKSDVAEKLGVTMFTLSKYFKKYEIKKDKLLIRTLREQTNLDTYGVTDPNKSPEVMERIRETNRKRYGVDYPIATKESQAHSKKVKQERYGDPNYNNSEKQYQTKQEKYGDKHYNNRNKMRKTMQEKYGVDNPFQLSNKK